MDQKGYLILMYNLINNNVTININIMYKYHILIFNFI